MLIFNIKTTLESVSYYYYVSTLDNWSILSKKLNWLVCQCFDRKNKVPRVNMLGGTPKLYCLILQILKQFGKILHTAC